MKNNYIIDKHIEKIYRYGYTDLLLPNEFLQVKNKLKKTEYNVYKPYIDSEKVILYKKVKPEIVLYKIICSEPLRHQDILGSLFSLNLSIYVYGDIVIDDGVWIGANATILSGVHIAEGCVIAAGAIVTDDTVPYGIYGGVPAKLIKMRFTQEQIEQHKIMLRKR